MRNILNPRGYVWVGRIIYRYERAFTRKQRIILGFVLMYAGMLMVYLTL